MVVVFQATIDDAYGMKPLVEAKLVSLEAERQRALVGAEALVGVDFV
jgi:hypothetical protein